ncbi:MAG: ATP-binding protein, partial [Pseudonocardiaceae bacterium]
MTREERLHAATLVSPAHERRRDRKKRRRATAQLLSDWHARTRAADLASDVEHEPPMIGPAGEAGPAMLRTHGRLRLPKHPATSATWGGAYP